MDGMPIRRGEPCTWAIMMAMEAFVGKWGYARCWGCDTWYYESVWWSM
jgi:hypothetical protein